MKTCSPGTNLKFEKLSKSSYKSILKRIQVRKIIHIKVSIRTIRSTDIILMTIMNSHWAQQIDNHCMQSSLKDEMEHNKNSSLNLDMKVLYLF